MNPFNTTLPDHYIKPNDNQDHTVGNIYSNLHIYYQYIWIITLGQSTGDGFVHSSTTHVSISGNSNSGGSGSFQLTNNGTDGSLQTKTSTYPPNAGNNLSSLYFETPF